MRKLVILAAPLLALAAPAQAERIVGLTGGNQLTFFDSATPGSVSTLRTVQGVTTGETLIGIDVRPNNGLLYGLTRQGGIYSISLAGGDAVATRTSTLGVALDGEFVGIDFNPLPDRLRIVTSNGQNLRVTVDTGLTDNDSGMFGPLRYNPGGMGVAPDINAGVTPFITSAAYTNSFAPSPRNGPGQPTGPGTTLFVIDANLDILTTQIPPNQGILNTVGTAGFVTGPTGFDISGRTGRGFSSYFQAGLGGDALFDMNVAGPNGGVTSIGRIGSGDLGIVDIAVAPRDVPSPAPLGLFGASLATFAFRRAR